MPKFFEKKYALKLLRSLLLSYIIVFGLLWVIEYYTPLREKLSSFLIKSAVILISVYFSLLYLHYREAKKKAGTFSEK